ncbi:MAG: response regulator transcription factor [Myxococcales bacterium]|nr:response regulator transcription factor [Myxococcales bacterium]
MAQILVVEDEADIAELIGLHLGHMGHAHEHVADGLEALAAARDGEHDLIILDLNLPRMDGLDITRTLRAEGIHTPILMLTSRTGEIDRVLGLELGADDYLTKPFSVRELMARVKAQLRRAALTVTASAPAPQVAALAAQDLRIDPARRTVHRGDALLDLTAREFDLLAFFARHPGRVYSRAQLLDHVWGAGYEGYEHTVNSHINRLRRKIEPDPQRPRYVQTVWGVGYRFGEG